VARQAADVVSLLEHGQLAPDPSLPLAVQLEECLHRLTVLGGLMKQERTAKLELEHQLEVRWLLWDLLIQLITIHTVSLHVIKQTRKCSSHYITVPSIIFYIKLRPRCSRAGCSSAAEIRRGGSLTQGCYHCRAARPHWYSVCSHKIGFLPPCARTELYF
jgi:hypothetical protein